MAVDLRNIGSRLDRPDTWFLYPSEAVESSTLKKGALPIARFHSRDVVEFQYESAGDDYENVIQYKGVIETIDDLSMARPNMFCVNRQTKELFIIDPPLVTANHAGVTSVSRRPNIAYTLTLRRVEAVE